MMKKKRGFEVESLARLWRDLLSKEVQKPGQASGVEPQGPNGTRG